MIPLIILLLLLSQITSVAIDSEAISTLSSSSYTSQATYRAYIKKRNEQFINSHNSQPEAKYKMFPYKRFADKTFDQIQEMILKKKELKLNHKLRSAPKPTTPTIMESFNLGTNIYVDWRDQGFVSPVTDQGYCGSCYAHTAIGDIQSSFRMKGKNISLSIQQIVDCSNKFGNAGCDGGWMGNVFEYVIANGITLQSSYPQRNRSFEFGETGICEKRKGQFRIRSYSYTSFKLYDCAGLTSIVKKRPVSVGVYANIAFVYYLSGIFQGCDPIYFPYINHAILATGIVQNEEQNYWICRNSWGVGWGEQGYIKIDRYIDYGNQCQICLAPNYSIL